MTAEERRARVLAFHLPQFYPTPENDEWWGPGFTEWTNTARGRRLFPGHYQPHIPADLGFYDLRNPETRMAQATLAADHGLAAFAYWHYWFAGRRMLERPVEEILQSGEPEFPFCLAWANQSWTGVWHGAPGRVLIEQTYPGEADDRAHFEYLEPFFRDRRYFRVGDRPLFYVFRPEELPDPIAFTDRWQRMARSAGFDGLYLVAELSDLHGSGVPYPPPEAMGFDAGVHVRLPFRRTRSAQLKMRARRKLGLPEMYRYSDTPVARPNVGAAPIFPAVYPNWDNTPRSAARGLVLTGSTPERFRVHLRDAIDRVQEHEPEERLVFVKSWNEWAEGNHLEPDLRFGRANLDVVAEETALAPTAGSPLRIAMTSYYLPSESKIGAGWMAHRLANALVDRGHPVTMFSPAAGPADARYQHRQVAVRGGLRTFRWGRSVAKLDVTNFDVLHAHGDDHFVAGRSLPAHVRTLHGSCFDEALHIRGVRERLRMLLLGVTEAVSAIRTPDVVGVSRNSLRWYPWLHRVIPNGVDLGRFGPGGQREPRPTILFVGTYHRRKRGALLQQVFVDYVLPRIPDAQLWMVCDDAPPGDEIEVLGRLTDEELADRYRRAWVFCLPSTYEGFGVPYIEAMASGTAVVATSNHGAREILDDGRLGVVSSDEDLGRNLVRMLVDEDGREALAHRALREVRKRYDWSVVAEEYEELYLRAIERRTRAV